MRNTRSSSAFHFDRAWEPFECLGGFIGQRHRSRRALFANPYVRAVYTRRPPHARFMYINTRTQG